MISFYDDKEDIICLKYLADEKDSDDIESAQQIIEGIKDFVIPEKPQAFLVESPTFYIEKNVLGLYQRADYGEIGRAIVMKSFTTKVMGNMFMRLTKNKPNEAGRTVPIKLFNTDEKAVEWLREQLKKAQ